MTITHAFIDGGPVAAAETYDNIDPATGESLGEVARCRDAEVDAAVAAARRAQSAWARTPTEKRADVLQAFAAAILDHTDELARMETEDTGKPLSQARTDAVVTARYFTFYARTIEAYYGLCLPVTEAFHTVVRREPIGVCAGIVAWNYPMQLFGRAVAPALAAGNSMVLKPAGETPRTAVRLAELAAGAGLPDGVLNVVPGLGPEAGQALADHHGIDHLGFVGSTRVGSLVAASAARSVIPTSLELGGKSPHVVFPDADLDEVVPYVTKGILQNAGQTCSAGSRLLVHSDIAAALCAGLREAFANVSIGPGADDPDLGPLVSRRQQDRVRSFIDESDGEILVGGSVPEGLSAGAYFSPTIVTGVSAESRIAREEVFGPVLTVIEFDTEEEAVRLANATDYALMAAIWTRDVSRALRLSAEVRAGQVYVNAFGAGGGVEYPFGGFKKSGYGREKGFEALDGYTATKTVLVKL